MRTIVTARLTLEPVAPGDVDLLHAMWVDPFVRRYLWDDVVIPRERAEHTVREAIAAAERNGRGMWLVRETTAKAPCGFCGFVPHDEPTENQLIYGLLPSACARGFATESARAIVEYGFTTLGLSRITASTDAPNVASVRVMERLGMRFVRRAAVSGAELLFYELERPTAPPGRPLR